VDQALLRAVVQIPDHPATFVVGRRSDTRAGGGKSRPVLRVRDGDRDEICELL
jgi:hypothetical protein